MSVWTVNWPGYMLRLLVRVAITNRVLQPSYIQEASYKLSQLYKPLGGIGRIDHKILVNTLGLIKKTLNYYK